MSDVFRKDLQAEFHRRLIRSEEAAEDAEQRSIMFLVRRMTKLNPAERVSATDALAKIHQQQTFYDLAKDTCRHSVRVRMT